GDRVSATPQPGAEPWKARRGGRVGDRRWRGRARREIAARRPPGRTERNTRRGALARPASRPARGTTWRGCRRWGAGALAPPGSPSTAMPPSGGRGRRRAAEHSFVHVEELAGHVLPRWDRDPVGGGPPFVREGRERLVADIRFRARIRIERAVAVILARRTDRRHDEAATGGDGLEGRQRRNVEQAGHEKDARRRKGGGQQGGGMLDPPAKVNDGPAR